MQYILEIEEKEQSSSFNHQTFKCSICIENKLGGKIENKNYKTESYLSAKKVINYLDEYHLLSMKYINYIKWRKAYRILEKKGEWEKIKKLKEIATFFNIKKSISAINYLIILL